ncbi:MAG: UDP-glucose 4-epimerase GalE [Rickettsiales bacterium]|jgi:UDP-arabinose 4-epimerase
MKKAILVAGGAGYIGSHLCKTLDAAGYLPVVIDNLCTGHRDFVRWGEFVEASISDLDIVAQTVEKYDISAVIDLAGSIEVAESVADPIKYYENNFACKLAFLQTLSKTGVKAFVFSSTAAVYGEPETIPIPEAHRKQPKSPYGWSKLLFEQLLSDFHLAGGPAWTALRYFNAAGASFDGDIGENHQPESHLIPRACFAALGRTPALEVYGNDYPTPDGTAIRDYIHVLDLASAHILALEALLDGKPPAAYNLGNGLGNSIQDILASFTKMGHPVPHSFKPRRAGDPARLVADNTAACAELGFKPRYDDIDIIISSAYKWHEKN